MRKNNLFDSLKTEDIKKLSLLKETIVKEELTRLRFSSREYDEIVRYCSLLGYLVHKKDKGKMVIDNGKAVYASPSINKQMKTIKIFNSKNHRWGYLQKLKDGIFYGYFNTNTNGDAIFIPKYSFDSNLEMFRIFSKLNSIDSIRLKAAAGIIELEIS
jgi:hypothetical protein